MRSKPVDIFLIILILIYTLLVVVMLAIDDILEEYPKVTLGLQVVELVLLAIFCVEIFLSLVGFGCMYFKDYWNIGDFIVILLTIILTVVDIYLADSNISNILRIRGIFRLLRVFMLLRRVSTFTAVRGHEEKSGHPQKANVKHIRHLLARREGH